MVAVVRPNDLDLVHADGIAPCETAWAGVERSSAAGPIRCDKCREGDGREAEMPVMLEGRSVDGYFDRRCFGAIYRDARLMMGKQS